MHCRVELSSKATERVATLLRNCFSAKLAAASEENVNGTNLINNMMNICNLFAKRKPECRNKKQFDRQTYKHTGRRSQMLMGLGGNAIINSMNLHISENAFGEIQLFWKPPRPGSGITN